MFNYKRYTFILIFLVFLLLVTDSSAEKQLRKSLLSFVNIVVEEGSEVSETAPSSFLDSLETGRISLYNFTSNQANYFDKQSEVKKGVVSGVYSFVYFILQFLKFICAYVITFYPAVVFFLYAFLTSRFFNRNSYDNSFGNNF